jgi:cobalt-zinc-cadmium resistance protein CzcA
MFDWIIRFSVSQRLLVLLLVFLLAGAGIYSFERLPIDAVPDVTNVQVQVLTSRPLWRRLKSSGRSPFRWKWR